MYMGVEEGHSTTPIADALAKLGAAPSVDAFLAEWKDAKAPKESEAESPESSQKDE